MTAQNRRMKKIIKEAFLELLESKPFNKISKEAICIKADIGHTTFYRYFQDKYNLATEIIREIIDEYFLIVEKSLPNKYTYYIHETYELFRNKQRILQLLTNAQSDELNVRNIIFHYISTRYKDDSGKYTNWFIETFHYGVILTAIYEESIFCDEQTYRQFVSNSYVKGTSALLNVNENELKEFIAERNPQ